MSVAVIVGRISRAHGIRGEVTVEVRTDSPDERFAEGAAVATEPAARGPLTIRRARWHSGRLLVQFDGITDRDAAEALRGTNLLVEIAEDDQPADPDEFYDHQLLGLSVVRADGCEVGIVREIVHGAAQDLLVIGIPSGEVFVPFVSQLVPEVDVAGGRVVIDPPPGLLDQADADDAGPGGAANDQAVRGRERP